MLGIAVEDFGNAITDEQARDYILKSGKLLPHFAEGVRGGTIEHTGGKATCKITHAPVKKFRIVLPLAWDFEFLQEGKNDLSRAADIWAAKIEAVARKLGIAFDKACTDPSRLFYWPSHRRGSAKHVEIVCGDFLNLDDYPIDLDKASGKAKAKGGKAKSGARVPGWIRMFDRDFTNAFDVADFMRMYFPNNLSRDGDVKAIVQCPFDYEHSEHESGDNANDPGFMCINATEADEGHYVMDCQHAHCAERNRIHFIAKAIETMQDDGRFTGIETLLEFVSDDPGTVGDDGQALDIVAIKENWRLKGVEGISLNYIEADKPPFDEVAFLSALESLKTERDIASDAGSTVFVELARAENRALELKTQGELKKVLSAAQFNQLLRDAKSQAKQAHAKASRIATVKGNPKPTIFSSDGFESRCEAVRRGLALRNKPEHLFEYGGRRVRLTRSLEGGAALEELTSERMDYECNRAVVVLHEDSDGKKRDVSLPLDVLRDVRGQGFGLLPELRRFSRVPLHTPSGTLHNANGYDPESRYYFDLRGLRIDTVPAFPSSAQVTEAVDLLTSDVLGDFPFTDDFDGSNSAEDTGVGSKANAVALLLHPFVRDLFDGAAPAYLIDKPSPGTGASLLVNTASIVANGARAAMQPYNSNDEEMRKVITSKLMAGVSLLVFDNINAKLRGGALASLITADVWSDRVLGSNQNFETKVRSQIVFTSNNIEMEDEQVRRIVPVRLDAKMANPTEGRMFKHASLEAWMVENRNRLVWACLVIVQNWFAKGCPKADLHLASFENYARVMGGVLDAAGVEGFLSNLDSFRGAKKHDTDDDTTFMQALLEMLEGKEAVARLSGKSVPSGFTAADVWEEGKLSGDDVNKIDLGSLGIRVDSGGNQSRRVSSKLGRYVGKVFPLRFRTWDDSKRLGGWKTDGQLEPITDLRNARFIVDGTTDGSRRFTFEIV